MTSKERLRAAILGEETDRVAWSPNLAYMFERLPTELQELGHMGFCKMIGADLLNRFGECPVRRIESEDVGVREWTEGDKTYGERVTPVGTIRHVYTSSEEGNTSFLVEHPLKTAEDCKVQLWIEEHARFERDAAVVASKESLDINMLIPEATKSAFQYMVEYLLGTEQVIYGLMDYPDEMEALWAALRENNRKALAIAAESDLDFFLTWEDSSTQNYSPSMYEKYIAPEICEWSAMLAANGKHYIQHACGHIKDLIPSMNACGVCAVESLSPVPTGNVTLKEARNALDPKIGIIGGIEPTELLNRSLKDLKPYVEQTIADGSAGPFVLANSDSCPPGVTIEKFKLISEIVQRS